MKKRLALILISIDECFTKEGFSGGGHKVTKHLVLGLIESGNFDIDIYCQRGVNEGTNEQSIDGINSINVLNKKTFRKELEQKLSEKHYDYILSSDILLPFANNLVHSNSSKYKSKNGKNKFMQFVLKFYNAKKIETQEKNMAKDKALFAVSEKLKEDYMQNFDLDESKVFVCHPAVDFSNEYQPLVKKENFTIGSMAGGGLNKGGYLLLFALKKISKSCNLNAKIIFPKIHKSGFFKFMVKILGLNEIVEVLPKQKNMDEYYKNIDCYILPSLNEAFGLVVPEAASNFKPSIVSSTTGVSEIVEDGVNGFVFNRAKNAVKNLSNKIVEVSNLYFNNYDKFIEISKNSHTIVEKLDWKKFTDIIIENLVSEEA